MTYWSSLISIPSRLLKVRAWRIILIVLWRKALFQSLFRRFASSSNLGVWVCAYVRMCVRVCLRVMGMDVRAIPCRTFLSTL